MIKGLIAKQVRSLVGSGRPPTDYLHPAGDPGLFGPSSMVWEIHRDFVSMMIGGISSLILQAQHPGALAGVWDHSTFRRDLRGRLKRTASFIAVTSYGSTEMATTAIKRVKAVHDHLHGVLPDGRPYRVSDPTLLYWVHLTETYSFLNSYELFLGRMLSHAEKDQYVREMCVIAKMLGCDLEGIDGREFMARTYDQLLSDINSYLPELDYSDRARAVIAIIEHAPSEPHLFLLNKLIIKAGFANLPDWLYPMIKRQVPTVRQRQLINACVKLLAQPIRWALEDGIHAQAKRRMKRTPAME